MIDVSKKKRERFEKAKSRSKKHLQVTADKPRLLVNRSNKFLYAQVIDVNGKSIVSVSSISKDLKDKKLGKTIESAKVIGKEIGRKLKEKKIDSVSFDRNGLKYHGRIKALADACREEGIKF
jgi:large subunit ribosomal protein L18